MTHAMNENRWHLLINNRSPHAGILPAFDQALRRFGKAPGYQRSLHDQGVHLSGM